MPRETRTSVFSTKNAARAVLYLLGSFFLLYPALSTPLIADDFLNPFSQSADGGSGLMNALRYGWRGSFDGASFRIFGTVIGGIFNWLWLTIGSAFDINLTSIYGAVKFVVFVGCAATVATFWWVTSRAYGKRTSYWDALAMTSVALFGTLQIHAIWSNDPVASYPLAGYVPAALGFAVLAACVVITRRPTWRWYLVATFFATFAVGYYEINIGAVLGGAIILSAAVWTNRGDRRQTIRSLVGGLTFVVVPAALVLYGRTVTAQNAATYSGTEVSLGKAPRTFVRGLVGSVPGSAWRLSNRVLGGRATVAYGAIGIVIFVALLIRWWNSDSKHAEPDSAPTVRNAGLVAALAAVLTYALFAIGLQAITPKVQDEMLEVGYAYTFYAMSSCVIALGLALGLKAFFTNAKLRSWRFPVFAFASAFLLVQCSVNWQLSAKMNDSYVSNRRLTAAFDTDVGSVDRCHALQDWSAAAWPAYYEQGMIDGLQVAYQYYFGQPFCKGFVSSG